MGNEVEIKERRAFIEQLMSDCSKKKCEDFFGICVKKQEDKDAKGYTYNVYRDEQLILAKQEAFEIGILLYEISEEIAQILCNEAIEDTNTAEADQRDEEMKERQKCFEEENYKVCPVCGEILGPGEIHVH